MPFDVLSMQSKTNDQLLSTLSNTRTTQLVHMQNLICMCFCQNAQYIFEKIGSSLQLIWETSPSTPSIMKPHELLEVKELLSTVLASDSGSPTR